MPDYNTLPPTPSTKNTITNIVMDYGVRDFLLNKNLLPVYPFLSTSLNGSPRIGEPVLDTMVGTGVITQPFGLPLETEGIIRMQIAILPNQFKDTSSTAGTLLNIDDIEKVSSFNANWPQGLQPYGYSGVYNYGIMGKTIEKEYLKKATIKNLYLDASKQVDSADWITLETLPVTQQIPGYLDVYGGLNLGGSAAIQASSVIGSVLNGQGLGLAKGGVVTNFDLRSSLAGRVLGATGLINDTKLGMIGGQQLVLALANNAAFNIQQDLLGALNVQDNVLSLVKGDGLVGFRPNYQITVPSGVLGKVADYTAKILGFTLPKSYLQDAGSIFLSESNSANIERANSMILNTGKGQVAALISNVNANLIGTGQYDNPDTAPFRSGYAPGYKDNKGKKAINPVVYAFGDADGLVYNFLINNKGVIPEISYNRAGMITEYGFTGPEENIGSNNPYSQSTIKARTMNWGSDEGAALNSENSPFGGNIIDTFVSANKKKTLLAKTQLLFNDPGMKTIVSAFGDINPTMIPSQIQTGIVGGGISKGNPVMSGSKYDENGIYTGELGTAVNTYCRSWTSHLRYDWVNSLVRSSGVNTTVPYRFQTKGSVLDQYGFPQIAPYSTDSKTDPKKYMFSIENLAWNDQVTDLLPCEVGPGDLISGVKGRIMWFPPYNIKINESSNVSWEGHQFIGRGENIYTYNNTERSGSISFSVIVDHPSYINAFRGADGPDDHYVASFWAGCVDPSTKFADKLTVSEISSLATQEITIPQEKVLTPEVAPSLFKFFYPNDYPSVEGTLAPINGQVYENGLATILFPLPSTSKIDYNTYISGNSIGSFAGNVTSKTTWNDNQNYGLNGWYDGETWVGDTPYSGVTDPAYFPALKTYLETKCPHCTVQIYSYASPQGNPEYNIKLAKQRSESMVAFITKTLFAGKDKKYIDARIKPPINEAIKSSSCFVSKDKENPAPVDTWPCKFDRRSMVAFEYDAALHGKETAQPEPIIKKQDQRINTKIINRFYTECNYFEQLTDADSFVFDKFREKIKYFHPAFHSTTPEGLNSRLTFLHQCTRQGRTLEDLGANNLAFGRAPVCILRVGDFYNTKIIIDSITIDYEPIVWDLNPEGIGVQPMVANVNMSFKFVGGSTLMGPINKLQNALSFNYYANTQVYDPRADYIAKVSDISTSLTGKERGYTDNEAQVSLDGVYGLVKGLRNLNTAIESTTTTTDIPSPEINQELSADNATGPLSPEQDSNATTTGTTIDDKKIISNISLKGYHKIKSDDEQYDIVFEYIQKKDEPFNLDSTANPINEYKGLIYITSSVNNDKKQHIGSVEVHTNGLNNGVIFKGADAGGFVDKTEQVIGPNVNTSWVAEIPIGGETWGLISEALEVVGSNISVEWSTGSVSNMGFYKNYTI